MIRNLRASQQVTELKGLNEVRVPDHAAVLDTDILERGIDISHLADTVIQRLLSAEDRDISLHSLLHSQANLGSALGAFRSADLVKNLNVLSTSISGKGLELVARGEVVADGVRDGATEDDKIQKRVGTETVGAVDRNASSLTASEQTRNNLVVTSLVDGEDLTSVASGDTTHVVVDGGEHRNRLGADVDTSENTSSLRNTRQALSENLSGQVAELEVDVVLLLTNTAALANLHRHGTRDDVTGGKILGGGSVALHEALTLGVEEVTTLTTGTLGDQAASAVDTSGVELDELEILVGETSAGNHGHAVTSASVRRRAAEVSTSVATGSQDSVVGKESVQSTILLVVGKDTAALAVLHNQVKGEELDEVVGVVAQRLAVQSVQEGVAGSVGSGAGAVSLATLAVVAGLATESTLVATVSVSSATLDCRRAQGYLHLAIVGTREGAAVVLKLVNRVGSLAGHVVDSILVTEPIGALDGIVHVASPVIWVHVAESGVDATLSSDRVRTGREELGDTGGVEASLSQTECGTKTGTTGTDHNGIVLVILLTLS